MLAFSVPVPACHAPVVRPADRAPVEDDHQPRRQVGAMAAFDVKAVGMLHRAGFHVTDLVVDGPDGSSAFRVSCSRARGKFTVVAPTRDGAFALALAEAYKILCIERCREPAN